MPIEIDQRRQHGARDEPIISAIAPAEQASERSRLAKFIGKLIILLTVISFLFVGILINILQLILITSFRFNSGNSNWRRWHKRINSHLVYILFSPPICLLYYWSNVSLRIQLDNLDLVEISKKPMLAVVLPNHTYVLDYMISFVLADQLGGVGSFKSVAKDELKYLPIIGWSMWMSDIIFVKRNWNSDKKIIGNKLNALLDYDQTSVGIFAEGTRFTKEKHKLSIEYARSRQIEPFKYHLVPRTKGFNYTVRHYLRALGGKLAEEKFCILNLQIVMPDEPKFRDFIEGKQLRAHVYCEEIKLSKAIQEETINSVDEDSCDRLGKLLMDIYRRKDQLMDEYLKHGEFPIDPKTGGLFPYRKNHLTFAIWLGGFCLTYGSLGYLAMNYLAKSALFWILLVSFIVGCVQMLKRIARESKIPRATKTLISNPSSSSSSSNRIHNDSLLKQKLV